MKSNRREKGAVLVLIAILIPLLLIALGLVVDNGQAFDTKRRLQKAADAAAIAAAQEMRRGNKDGAEAAAIKNAALNGAAAPDAQVTVTSPPKTGPRAGDPWFMEVTVRRASPLYFMRAIYEKDLMVEARAVAGITNGKNCIIALNKTASPGLLVSGTADVDAGECGVQVNSSASTGLRANGGAILEAANIAVAGGYSGVGFSPSPVTGAKVMEDPLSDLPPPPVGACTSKKAFKITATTTLSPGVYCGGITVNAGAVANLKPGIYVLMGGLSVLGGGTIQGDEVMFYNTQSPYGPIEFAGTSTAKLTAPKSGPYTGILFFTDREVVGGKMNKFAGTDDSYFTGALYFPKQPLTFTGTAGMETQKVLIIADTVEFQGNVQFKAPSAADGLPTYTMNASLVY